MRNVQQLLQQKGRDVWTIPPEASVLDALRRLADKDIGAMPVVDGDRLVGMFSERDYARKLILANKRSYETRVAEVMTAAPITIGLGATVDACMATMTDARVRHLPVVEDGRLIGVISIGDVVKSIISAQAETINHLETYINGATPFG